VDRTRGGGRGGSCRKRATGGAEGAKRCESWGMICKWLTRKSKSITILPIGGENDTVGTHTDALG